jgi:hypothetical protein
MAVEMFKFGPAEVPRASRGLRKSKYGTTVEAVYEYLQENADQTAVKIELGSVDIKSAAASFRNAIAKRFPDAIRMVQRGGDLYIERL